MPTHQRQCGLGPKKTKMPLAYPFSPLPSATYMWDPHIRVIFNLPSLLHSLTLPLHDSTELLPLHDSTELLGGSSVGVQVNAGRPASCAHGRGQAAAADSRQDPPMGRTKRRRAPSGGRQVAIGRLPARSTHGKVQVLLASFLFSPRATWRANAAPR
jgi:hypothetical protein